VATELLRREFIVEAPLARTWHWFYARLVDRAIPRLQAQLASAHRGG
jgi:hypothetical protein